MVNLKNYFSQDIFKISALTSISTLVKVVSNLISAKLIAIYAGPMGMAVLGQLTSLSSIFLNLSTGATTSGVVKMLSEKEEDNLWQQNIIKTAFQLTFVYSTLATIILVFGSRILGRFIFGSDQFNSILVIFGFTILFYALNLQFLSILNGLKKFKGYISLSIITSVIGLIFNIVLVVYLKTYGVLLAYVTSQSIVFIYTFYVIRTKGFISVSIKDFLGGVDFNIVKNLSRLSLMSITSIIMVPLSQVLIRNIITSNLSIDSTGIWEATNKISSMYLMLITSSLAVYFMPKISGITDKRVLRNEIKATYKFILPLLGLITFIIFFSRQLIIQLLFTSEFADMAIILPYQLIGDVLKMIAWVLGYVIMSRGLVKRFIFSEVVLGSISVIAVFLLVPIYGLVGSIYAHIITSTLAILLYFGLVRKSFI